MLVSRACARGSKHVFVRCLALCLMISSMPLCLKWFQIIRQSVSDMPLTKIYWVTREYINDTGHNNTVNYTLGRGARLCPSQIPKIIHLTFASEQVYTNYKQYLKGCLELNSDWQVYLWRDSDSSQFINKYYPNFAKKFNSYSGDLQKSDAVRYAVLHQFGGVYLDMDIECARPLFPLLQSRVAFVDRERWEQAALLYDRPMTLMNSAMGSVPRHPFFLFVLQKLSSFSGSYPVDSTGPGALTKIYHDWLTSSEAKGAPELAVLESEVFSGTVDMDNPVMKIKCQGISTDFNNPSAEVKTRLAAELTGFNPSGTTGGTKARDRRWLACASLTLTDWSPGSRGLFSNATVGVHKFMHLGYGFASGKRGPKFNLLGEFPGRVRLPDGGRGVPASC